MTIFYTKLKHLQIRFVIILFDELLRKYLLHNLKKKAYEPFFLNFIYIRLSYVLI